MFALRLLSEGSEGSNTELQWLLLAGIVFFFVLVIVGWWTNSRKQEQVEGPSEAKNYLMKEADNLLKIEGIGPKVIKVLKRAGITTFDELAHAKSVDLQKSLDAAGLHMMDSEGWIDQARLAAKADWQGLEKMQAELKGGRKAK